MNAQAQKLLNEGYHPSYSQLNQYSLSARNLALYTPHMLDNWNLIDMTESACELKK